MSRAAIGLSLVVSLTWPLQATAAPTTYEFEGTYYGAFGDTQLLPPLGISLSPGDRVHGVLMYDPDFMLEGNTDVIELPSDGTYHQRATYHTGENGSDYTFTEAHATPADPLLLNLQIDGFDGVPSARDRYQSVNVGAGTTGDGPQTGFTAQESFIDDDFNLWHRISLSAQSSVDGFDGLSIPSELTLDGFTNAFYEFGVFDHGQSLG